MLMKNDQLHREFAFIVKVSEYPFLAALIRRCELEINEDENGLSISLQLPTEFNYSSFEHFFPELERHGKAVCNRNDVRLIVWKAA